MFEIFYECLLISLLYTTFSTEARFVFKDDRTYTYHYETNFEIARSFGENSGKRELTSNYGLTSMITITSFRINGSTHLLQLEISVNKHTQGDSDITGLSQPRNPAIIKFKNGIVDRIWIREDETTFWTNYIKGIASLIHIDEISNVERRRTDISGDCDVEYATSDNIIEKVKTNCSTTDFTFEMRSPESRIPLILKSEIQTIYDVNKEGLLKTVISTEKYFPDHSISSLITPLITSQQILSFFNDKYSERKDFRTVENVLKSAGLRFKSVYLQTLLDTNMIMTLDQFRKEFNSTLNELRRSKETGNTTESLSIFIKLLHSLRCVYDEEGLRSFLMNFSQKDVYPEILDLFAACQTGPCVRILFDHLDFNEGGHAVQHQRVLFSLSHVTDPSTLLLSELFKKIKNSRFQDKTVEQTAWITLSSVAGKLVKFHPSLKVEILDDVVEFIHKSLKLCEAEDCTLAGIEAMRNVGPGEGVVEALMNIIQNSSFTSRVYATALKTLSDIKIPKLLMKNTSLQLLKTIFLIPKVHYDNSILKLAIDVLLKLGIDDHQITLMRIILGSKLEPFCYDHRKHWTCRYFFGLPRRYDNIFQKTLETSVMNNTYINGRFYFDQLHTLDWENKRFLFGMTMNSSSLISIILHTNSKHWREPTNEQNPTGTLNVLGRSSHPMKLTTSMMGYPKPNYLLPKSNLLLQDTQTILHLQNGFVLKFSWTLAGVMDVVGSFTESGYITKEANYEINTAIDMVLHTNVHMNINGFVQQYEESLLIPKYRITFSSKFLVNGSPEKQCNLLEREEASITHSFRLRTGFRNATRTKVFRQHFSVPGLTFLLSKQCTF